MQRTNPKPTFRPCCEMGAMRPTTYLPSTMLPAARISKDGKGRSPVTAGAVGGTTSESASPVWPVDCTGGPPGGTEADTSGSKSCAQVRVLAGICTIVLHGTISSTPFTRTVPPARMGSLGVQMAPAVSRVAASMNPRKSNCGVGEGCTCALASVAQIRAEMAIAAHFTHFTVEFTFTSRKRAWFGGANVIRRSVAP